ncbi:MAG TPA: hypothetical protein VF693_09260 [Allosphingosinicella sp.]|jgi:hypothetical protein
MRLQILFPLMALAVSSACAGDRQADNEMPAQGSMAIPVSLSPTFPVRSVDHVATYASWRGWGPRDGDRATIVRHGALVRLETRLIATRRPGEAEVETSFSNLATGAAISVHRDAQGALSGVTLWQGEREEAQLPVYRHRLVPTEGFEEIAGERCSVWRAEPHSREGVAYTACVSPDGILLRDTVLHRDGTTMSERRAISVERRPVAPAEVLPPRGALDWLYWERVPAARQRENYALMLTARGGTAGRGRRTFLADGLLKREEERAGDQIRSLTVVGSGVSLNYSNHGRPQLAISRADESSGSALLSSNEPMADRPPGRLLGESCNWVNATAGVADYSRIECRAADGLPLIIEERSRGSGGRWEAVSLSRGQMPAGSARPPADLLRWSRWGWPMLDGR